MLVLDMMRYGTESAQKNFDDRYFRFNHPMMEWMGDTTGIWIYSLLCIVTWIIVIAVLIALLRWLWKKGDQIK